MLYSRNFAGGGTMGRDRNQHSHQHGHHHHDHTHDLGGHQPHHHHHHPHEHPKHESPTRRDFISSLMAGAVLLPWLQGQSGTQSQSDMAERFRQISEQYEAEGLAAPFKGITTNGQVVPALFEIKPTGVSTEPVRNAAEAFIATLTPVQLGRTIYPVDDIEWRKWMNQH